MAELLQVVPGHWREALDVVVRPEQLFDPLLPLFVGRGVEEAARRRKGEERGGAHELLDAELAIGSGVRVRGKGRERERKEGGRGEKERKRERGKENREERERREAHLFLSQSEAVGSTSLNSSCVSMTSAINWPTPSGSFSTATDCVVADRLRPTQLLSTSSFSVGVTMRECQNR